MGPTDKGVLKQDLHTLVVNFQIYYKKNSVIHSSLLFQLYPFKMFFMNSDTRQDS